MTIPGRVRIFAVLMFTLIGSNALSAPAEPVAPSDIQVIDATTIRARGASVTLLGFDAPRRGVRALCSSERRLGERAIAQLRAIIAAGGTLSLQIVPCPCRTATQGTPLCNRGRACGVLRAGNSNVGDALIKDGLAHAFVCGETRCPRQRIGRWCAP